MADQEVKLPPIAESITEGKLLSWHKKAGDFVEKDEPLAEFETDKANVDLPSPSAGVLTATVAQVGQTVRVGDIVARLDTDGKAGVATPAAKSGAAKAEARSSSQVQRREGGNGAPATQAASTELSPAVRRLVSENHLDPARIPASGPGGRLTKEDVMRFLERRTGAKDAPVVRDQHPFSETTEAPRAPQVTPQQPALPLRPVAGVGGGGQPIRREPMSKIRKRIAQNLVQAQQTAAILTTFNEVDLTEVMELRRRYKESFEKKYGVGLGFMSFFARAVCVALGEYERVNARIDGEEIVYHDYVNLGIAVSTDRGLTVPVIRNAHAMSFAQLEGEIKRVATAARDGKLALEEMSGGTFTVTNGGVFGSLLSTPILNPPQSGILGMHAIQDRPMAVNGEVKIRPMMYVAFSYDHRMIDGRESVTFLVRVKQLLEDPSRLLLDV
jgi:2-oxoglutarate dehydrogenase E2 component (dihydrolipoamide succinyltransferase)